MWILESQRSQWRLSVRYSQKCILIEPWQVSSIQSAIFHSSTRVPSNIQDRRIRDKREEGDESNCYNGYTGNKIEEAHNDQQKFKLSKVEHQPRDALTFYIDTIFTSLFPICRSKFVMINEGTRNEIVDELHLHICGEIIAAKEDKRSTLWSHLCKVQGNASGTQTRF